MSLCPGLPGRPVPEETFTHSRPSWSSDIPYQLPPSSTIYTVFLVQFTCLTFLFHNLFPGPVWSSSWSGALYFILHAFLHPIIISFCSTCPYHRSKFCCNTNVMSSIPNLYLSSLLGNLSFSLIPHIHLTILIPPDHSHLCLQKCHHVFFPYSPCLTSMQHTASHTTDCCTNFLS